ncbi:MULTISPECIES: 3-dehydro-L-gulonate 2-dehydrogenase [Anaerotruncus]|jgi:3-dehydro-L-gulonate 2-dehydrogenase|uniref:3-dehydro-L-gulonate 2-dehydrogenase n=1 Tax=Anaerotruncus TaxID=244127 RepID=UPI00082BD261|nr:MULTISPECIES: 3-dehydro-L-gulonate 2-dehydrogenase [Anaerotruncus]RGX56201.1 3-dehydro-L-gulonate 2-dehydrogenase [Anaerotruncus sp. AF02-27]
MRIPYDELVAEFNRVLIKKGFDETDALEAAKIFADNSVDGVYSHGVNRFPRVVSYIEKGYIKPDKKAIRVGGSGGFERWDGQLGMGNLNAKRCMDRAVELAGEYGVGVVALGNNNHWMRGGYFGWQAADAGCIGICWTNTMPNMPAWGGKDRRIGNNPFIIAIPRSNGEHVVIDCAMAQFSYGKIEECRLKKIPLPVVGGYDSNGNVTTDPAEIEKTWRVLPIGYWKGSGISIALDLVATVLSGGLSVTAVGKKCEEEYALSQMLIAIDPRHVAAQNISDMLINEVIDDIKASEPATEGGKILYPGEPEILTRRDNLANGIPVLEEIWAQIKAM